MITVLNLLEDAAVEAKILAPGVSWANPKSAAALRILNRMLGIWSEDELLVNSENEETCTLTASAHEYTIGESGSPDFNSARPIEILPGTFIRDGTTDYPLNTEKTYQQYEAITHKSTTGLPYMIVLNPTYPNATFYVHYSPSSNYSLHLLSLKELTTYSSTGTTVSLSQAYQDAIVYNLAIRLSTGYGKKISQDLRDLAKQALDTIRTRNAKRLQRAASLETADLSDHYPSGNILTGWQ